jgi:hypothetical protein
VFLQCSIRGFFFVPDFPMLVDAYNAFEAGLWALLAVVIAIRYRQTAAGLRRAAAITSGLLLLFAISDVIEMYTGAWWKPPALLVYKGFCLVGLVWSVRRLIRRVADGTEKWTEK